MKVGLLMVFLSTGILSLGTASDQRQGEESALKQDVCGRLDTVEGQSVLSLWGTPEDRGFAEGFLMAKTILVTFEEYCLSPRMMPDPTMWNLMAIPLVKQRVDISDSLRQRAEGLSKGIVAALGESEGRSEKLGRVLGADDFIAIASLIDWIGQFCSSFVAHGDMIESPPGPLVGRNLDYPSSPEMARNTLIKVEAPDSTRGAHGWISFGWPGMIGCVTGVSDAGVSVAIHDVPAPAPKEGKVKPRVDILAQLIETLEPGASTAEEASLLVGQHQYAMGANFMLAWGHADHRGGAVLEVGPDRSGERGVSVRSSGDTFVVCTNHHRERIPAFECGRYNKLADQCALVVTEDRGPIDFESGWELIGLASVPLTVYRLMIDLEEGRIRFQHRLAPRGEWSEARDFDRAELLETCVEHSEASK